MLKAVGAALGAAFLLSACSTPYGEAARHLIAEKGKQEASAQLSAAEWFICRAAPVGAIIDRYASRWEAWAKLCSGSVPDVPGR